MAGSLAPLRRLGANASRVVRLGVARLMLPPRRGFWLRMRLARPLDELKPPALPFARTPSMSLLDCLQTLEAAALDDQVSGVLLVLQGAPRGWGKVLAVRRAVERLRDAGKPVVAYAESMDAQDLLMASAATRLWMPPAGSLTIVGLRAESLFLHGLLERLDVEPEVVRVGRYKAAAEMFTREGMSPEARAQTEAILDDLYDVLVEGIARGRGLEPRRVREIIDRGLLRAGVAVEAGLIDACMYSDEIEEQLALLSPDPPPERAGSPAVRVVDWALYHALRTSDPGWRPLLGDLPRFAYLVSTGAMHRGGGPYGIASDTLRELLEQVRRDPGVRGVLLRIESPGGDGLAADLIWRSVQRTAREKPVVVSMGDVAASGGYYVATAADVVFAERATLTGSIGVVGGKLNLRGLLERLGIGEEGIERGARAGMLSPSRGFTGDERAALRGDMEAFYELFLDRVVEGRGLERSDLVRWAQGRVWTGLRARRLGLVDSLGGPLEALRELRRRADLAEGDRFMLEVHPRLPRLGSLRSLVGLLSTLRSG